MNSNITNPGNIPNNANVSNSILPYFTTFFIILGIATFAAIFYEQNVPIYRTSFMSPILAVVCACIFMYFIYTLREREIDVFGKKIDTGVVVYIFILAFVFYVLGG
jgi:hypothetical protein